MGDSMSFGLSKQAGLRGEITSLKGPRELVSKQVWSTTLSGFPFGPNLEIGIEASGHLEVGGVSNGLVVGCKGLPTPLSPIRQAVSG